MFTMFFVSEIYRFTYCLPTSFCYLLQFYYVIQNFFSLLEITLALDSLKKYYTQNKISIRQKTKKRNENPLKPEKKRR